MRKLWLLLLLAAVSAAGIWGFREVARRWQGQAQATAQSAEMGAVSAETVTLNPADLQAGIGEGVSITSAGVSLAPPVNAERAGQFVISQIAPLPFNVVVPRWQATIPPDGQLNLYLRTAPENGPWTEWYPLQVNPDLTLPTDPDTTGDFIAVPAADVTHRRLEVAVNLLPAPNGETPVLHGMTFTFIDSIHGAMGQGVTALNSADTRLNQTLTVDPYPKPAVVSRAQWCNQPECNYSDGLQYYPVTHLIVHHTVSNNDTVDWLANVRAIWYYHTFTRGWGDIGYNYLVDPNGVIYEGHLGGDDVVGTHASGANRGSLGVALLGTFSVDTPPEPMLNALADLLAWKTAQKQLDLADASTLPDLDWGLLNLVGHRDVYGTTECPGSAAHLLIPQIRDRINQKIGFTTSYRYIDELSDDFTRSPATWYDGPYQCGFDSHAYYTFSTTDPNQAVNWGEWNLALPTGGHYSLDVYVPRCNTDSLDTEQAIYKVTHAGGISTVTISQQANLGLWTSVGEFNFNTSGGKLRLADLTPNESGRPIWFDAVRLRFLETLVVNLQPPPDVWLTASTVNFVWQVNHFDAIDHIQVQAATDGGFANVILAQDVGGQETSLSHTFSQDYPVIYWRILVTTVTGNVLISTPTTFHLDTAPPTSSVVSLYTTGDDRYQMTWQGVDATSGIDSYDVAYRPDGASNWTTLLNNTTVTRTLFTPPNPNLTYWLRVQATDRAGNSEALKQTGDINTTQATPYLGQPATLLQPAAGSWQRARRVTFMWDIPTLAAVAGLQLEAATGPDFANHVLAVSLPPSLSYEYTFSLDYNDLYWRVTLTTVLGETFVSAPARFGIDATPPVSRVRDGYTTADQSYLLQLEAADNESGLADLTLEYQVAGSSSWQVWADNLSGDPVLFTPPNPALRYVFRSLAQDRAGNLEALPELPDFATDQALPYLGSPAQPVEPPEGVWRINRTVTMRWSVAAPTAVRAMRLQVALDPGFTNVILNQVFDLPAVTYTQTFGQDYNRLYWRVILTTVLGEQFTSQPASFRLDATPPTSDVTNLVEQAPGGVYRVTWAGSDALSGLSGYLLEYRRADQSTWLVWFSGSLTEGIFTPPQPGVNYWLRSRAVDMAGNVEVGDPIGDISLADAVPYVRQIFLPVLRRSP